MLYDVYTAASSLRVFVKRITPYTTTALTTHIQYLNSRRSMASDTTAPTKGRCKVILQPGFGLADWMHLQTRVSSVSTPSKPITIDELETHNKKSDCWMAINGKVYDVTKYMPYHPGGIPTLMKGAGKDSTDLFNKFHPWVNAESMMSKCIVGKLVVDRRAKETTVFTGISQDTNKENPIAVAATVTAGATVAAIDANADTATAVSTDRLAVPTGATSIVNDSDAVESTLSTLKVLKLKEAVLLALESNEDDDGD